MHFLKDVGGFLCMGLILAGFCAPVNALEHRSRGTVGTLVHWTCEPDSGTSAGFFPNRFANPPFVSKLTNSENGLPPATTNRSGLILGNLGGRTFRSLEFDVSGDFRATDGFGVSPFELDIDTLDQFGFELDYDVEGSVLPAGHVSHGYTHVALSRFLPGGSGTIGAGEVVTEVSFPLSDLGIGRLLTVQIENVRFDGTAPPALDFTIQDCTGPGF